MSRPQAADPITDLLRKYETERGDSEEELKLLGGINRNFVEEFKDQAGTVTLTMEPTDGALFYFSNHENTFVVARSMNDMRTDLTDVAKVIKYSAIKPSQRFITFVYRKEAHFVSVVIDTTSSKVILTNSGQGNTQKDIAKFQADFQDNFTIITEELKKRYPHFKPTFSTTPIEHRVSQNLDNLCNVHSVINSVVQIVLLSGGGVQEIKDKIENIIGRKVEGANIEEITASAQNIFDDFEKFKEQLLKHAYILSSVKTRIRESKNKKDLENLVNDRRIADFFTPDFIEANGLDTVKSLKIGIFLDYRESRGIRLSDHDRERFSQILHKSIFSSDVDLKKKLFQQRLIVASVIWKNRIASLRESARAQHSLEGEDFGIPDLVSLTIDPYAEDDTKAMILSLITVIESSARRGDINAALANQRLLSPDLLLTEETTRDLRAKTGKNLRDSCLEKADTLQRKINCPTRPDPKNFLCLDYPPAAFTEKYYYDLFFNFAKFEDSENLQRLLVFLSISLSKKESELINITGNFGENALHHAIYYENSPAVKMLVERGIDIYKVDSERQSPLKLIINKYSSGNLYSRNKCLVILDTVLEKYDNLNLKLLAEELSILKSKMQVCTNVHQFNSYSPLFEKILKSFLVKVAKMGNDYFNGCVKDFLEPIFSPQAQTSRPFYSSILEKEVETSPNNGLSHLQKEEGALVIAKKNITCNPRLLEIFNAFLEINKREMGSEMGGAVTKDRFASRAHLRAAPAPAAARPAARPAARHAAAPAAESEKRTMVSLETAKKLFPYHDFLLHNSKDYEKFLKDFFHNDIAIEDIFSDPGLEKYGLINELITKNMLASEMPTITDHNEALSLQARLAEKVKEAIKQKFVDAKRIFLEIKGTTKIISSEASAFKDSLAIISAPQDSPARAASAAAMPVAAKPRTAAARPAASADAPLMVDRKKLAELFPYAKYSKNPELYIEFLKSFFSPSKTAEQHLEDLFISTHLQPEVSLHKGEAIYSAHKESLKSEAIRQFQVAKQACLEIKSASKVVFSSELSDREKAYLAEIGIVERGVATDSRTLRAAAALARRLSTTTAPDSRLPKLSAPIHDKDAAFKNFWTNPLRNAAIKIERNDLSLRWFDELFSKCVDDPHTINNLSLEFESDHLWIQTFFPTTAPSEAYPNDDTPLLNPSLITWFKESGEAKENFLKVFEKMLNLYGMEVVRDGDNITINLAKNEGGVVLIGGFTFTPSNALYKNDLNYNHNFKRLSRIMNSCAELGFKKEAAALQQCLVNDPAIKKSASVRVIQLWKDMLVGGAATFSRPAPPPLSGGVNPARVATATDPSLRERRLAAAPRRELPSIPESFRRLAAASPGMPGGAPASAAGLPGSLLPGNVGGDQVTSGATVAARDDRISEKPLPLPVGRAAVPRIKPAPPIGSKPSSDKARPRQFSSARDPAGSPAQNSLNTPLSESATAIFKHLQGKGYIATERQNPFGETYNFIEFSLGGKNFRIYAEKNEIFQQLGGGSSRKISSSLEFKEIAEAVVAALPGNAPGTTSAERVSPIHGLGPNASNA